VNFLCGNQRKMDHVPQSSKERGITGGTSSRYLHAQQLQTSSRRCLWTSLPPFSHSNRLLCHSDFPWSVLVGTTPVPKLTAFFVPSTNFFSRIPKKKAWSVGKRAGRLFFGPTQRFRCTRSTVGGRARVATGIPMDLTFLVQNSCYGLC
jgi:hypothetical protein